MIQDVFLLNAACPHPSIRLTEAAASKGKCLFAVTSAPEVVQMWRCVLLKIEVGGWEVS